ncbi:MAG: hypothetical protein JHC30_05920 [Caldisericum sp.]|jgi:hypothetical protein|nr:hypothetical protein [Caldisericum sp.]
MKWGKKILLTLLVFVFALNVFISNVKGATYTYTQLSGSSFNWHYEDYGSNDGYFYVYSGGGSFGITNITFSIFKVGDVDYRNAIVYDNNTSATIGNYNLVGFKLHYNRSILNSGSLLVGKVVEVKASFSGVAYNDTYQGSFYLKGVFNSNGSISNVVLSDAPSFSLVYNNDYNYTSNTASFTLQYSNFSFNYFTFLNTDTPQGQTIYGYHLLNYNLTQSGLTYVVHCSFDNTFVNLSNPHYLFWTVHGLDNNGNPIDLSGSTSFNLNAPNVPQVPKGVLVITSPKTGDNFESGTTQIPVSVVYGGDVTDVTDPNYNHTSVTVGATHALHNAGYVDLTSYSIINGTTVWSGTLTLNSGEGDGEYTLLASLDHTTLMSDTVTITIGSTTGNAVLDFLKAVWAEFKDWFVKTMKLLFVPDATDFSSQIAQGWVQVSNPLPSVTPLYTIDIPMSTALGTKNGVATIDFKTPITSWSGYPTMQSVIRVGLYTLLVFVIWSMVT